MGSETETLLINRHSVQKTTTENKTPITNLSSADDKTEYFGKTTNTINQNTINNYTNGNIQSTNKFTDDDNDDEDEIVPHHHNSLISNANAGIGTDHTFKRKVVWFNALGFLLLHIVGVVGLLSMILGYTKTATNVYFLILGAASGMGVTAGAHRLFSHRSYKAATWLRVTLLLLHTMAGQNCLYVWVRDHRQHHKFSDTDADPHNATRGFFFSHVGWLMSRKHPKVLEYGKKIDMSDMEADPWIMFQKKYYKTLYFIFVILIPTSIPCYFWGESLILAMLSTYLGRTIMQLNFTWSVNSVAHLFGNKPYDKNILPVESRLVSLVAGGEGWHNYHHTFPWDYRAAELGMPLNVTTKLIDLLAKYGHVYDRKSVTNEMLLNRIQRTGDGSHEKYGIETLKTMPSTDEILPKDDNSNNIIINNNNYNNNNNNNNLNSNNQDIIIKKYILDKNEMNKLNIYDKNTTTTTTTPTKFDDLNNNCNKKYTDLTSVKDLNRIVDNQTFKPLNKQALNVCSS